MIDHQQTRRTGHHLVASAFILLLFGCVAPTGARNGQLVIVGGGLRDGNSEVFTAFVSKAGQRIAVLPTASGVPVRSGPGTAKSLSAYSSAEQVIEVVPIHFDTPERALAGEWVETIKQADAVWFTGGVQSRILDVFCPGGKQTPAYRAVLDVLERGGCVAGSSAGAAMMSDPMIAWGNSAEALLCGMRDEIDDRALKIQQGMGFFPFGIVDQHFLRRGRIGRLIVALEHTGRRRGYGIADNSALAVDLATARGHALGDRAVLAIDADTARREGFARRGLRISLLSSGDEVDFRTGVLTPDPGKHAVAPGRMPRPTRKGELKAWGRGTLTRLLERLSSDPTRAWKAAGETFTLVVRADERTTFLARSASLQDLTVIDAILDVEAGARAAERAAALAIELKNGKGRR